MRPAEPMSADLERLFRLEAAELVDVVRHTSSLLIARRMKNIPQLRDSSSQPLSLRPSNAASRRSRGLISRRSATNPWPLAI